MWEGRVGDVELRANDLRYCRISGVAEGGNGEVVLSISRLR